MSRPCRPFQENVTLWEQLRDAILAFLALRVFLLLAVVWGVNVIGWGACYGALLVGIDGGLSTSEKQRWMNLCIQILTGLFTFLTALTLPW